MYSVLRIDKSGLKKKTRQTFPNLFDSIFKTGNNMTAPMSNYNTKYNSGN